MDNTCITIDTFLQQPNSFRIAQDYSDALLQQYDGIEIRSATAINLWDVPNGDTVLGTVTKGNVLHLLNVKDGWYRVSWNDVIGYCRTQYAVPVLVDTNTDQTTSLSAPAEPQPMLSSPDEVEVTMRSADSAALRQQIADSAMSWVGVGYSYGGSSRSGTDCSGFTMAVFSEFGYTLTHGASDQYSASRSVTSAQRDVGDLVFFNWGNGIEHVGIYLGGGTFVHASTSSGVIISSLFESYYANGYIGAARILPD